MKKRIIALLLCLLLAIPLAACGNSDNPDPCKDGHAWDEWRIVTAATEIADGLKEHKCTRCGEKEQDAIPKIVPTGMTDDEIVAEALRILDGTDSVFLNAEAASASALISPKLMATPTAFDNANLMGKVQNLPVQNKKFNDAAKNGSDAFLAWVQEQITPCLDAPFSLGEGYLDMTFISMYSIASQLSQAILNEKGAAALSEKYAINAKLNEDVSDDPRYQGMEETLPYSIDFKGIYDTSAVFLAELRIPSYGGECDEFVRLWYNSADDYGVELFISPRNDGGMTTYYRATPSETLVLMEQTGGCVYQVVKGNQSWALNGAFQVDAGASVDGVRMNKATIFVKQTINYLREMYLPNGGLWKWDFIEDDQNPNEPDPTHDEQPLNNISILDGFQEKEDSNEVLTIRIKPPVFD